MKTYPSLSVTFILLCSFFFFFSIFFTYPVSVLFVNGLGSASTIAITYGSGTVCGILAGKPIQRIECYYKRRRNGHHHGHHGYGYVIQLEPEISYEVISGGRNFLCGLRSGGFSFYCWSPIFHDDDDTIYYSSFEPKRVYFNTSVRLKDLTVGENHVCALENVTGVVQCWWREAVEVKFRFLSPGKLERFKFISSGNGFSCGVLMDSNNRVRCWGVRGFVAEEIQNQFGNMSMLSLVAGDSHVCGLNYTGFLICKGNNNNNNNMGLLDFPIGSRAFEFSGIALGVSHGCAIRRLNGTVVCWGGNGRFWSNDIEGLSFELIVAGSEFTCGLTTRNLSMICWGPGWLLSNPNRGGMDLPLAKIIPGQCTQSSCGECGIYIDSDNLCSGSNSNICKQCDDYLFNVEKPIPSPIPPSQDVVHPPNSSSSLNSIVENKGLLAFAIVGFVGILSGFSSIVYCWWSGGGICCCNQQQKIHNSVQPTITGTTNSNMGSARFSPPISRSSSTFRRQSSRSMRRQRSGPSSKHTDRAEEFTFQELAAATNGFSLDNKIGSGSFGIVYKGKLQDGREVAIKRGETGGTKKKKFQEKESAFESELAFLSRLHHKHLVSLVGFCDENDERLLVYEYMKNGALYDHIHSKNNTHRSSSVLNSWKMRMKVLLDAARGIEYLHNYAVPPIIHRDIKSSNILLDANWVARVSDFGLSLMGPQFEGEYMSAKAAGTVGYMDPEYYGLNVLTAKSDVYGLGVVVLELLTGRKAIFKDDNEDDEGPTSVVDYAVPKIKDGELGRVLDVRVGLPDVNEVEAVELVANMAVHCVNLEGKERPSMTDIVANLERALALCDESYGSISSASITVASE